MHNNGFSAIVSLQLLDLWNYLQPELITLSFYFRALFMYNVCYSGYQELFFSAD